MRGLVYYNGTLAGYLEKTNEGYRFSYENNYQLHPAMPAISLLLPKSAQIYESEKLFPFFEGLLSEGVNKDIQCRLFRIDENDDFTRLLLSSRSDTIGAITVKPEDDDMFRMLY